jgi:hypothetical protein
MESEHRYDDLLDLPHPVSQRHAHMSAHDRAAQFSPFAALTGHGAAMEETARLTDRKLELSELQLEELNANLLAIQARIREKPAVQITYFVPDARKSGGEYRSIRGRVRHIDEGTQTLFLTDDTRIPLNDILTLAPDQIE